ncbi:conserved hypothetical protein [Neospora caninum Liverpool]|uniref:Glutaredoxin domain-containing protein n=1 Tax=Neospora caninum (strain Liverpool) TaxID=572307 RepID=F0VBB8_NEOCL|nr:conserved hypothetical protein [Neospora caninum Liverpool]CBZ50902.1 conserved hypothetical protein [Neospora caninum Liverpool]CEL68204.1 TPA: hypothetical protein BN1204_039770 [Neospora caninum Liverpool]|eukprot:XP_003880935.1 conserved hypothetical protein [Neospora caninum Liverpool]
MSDPEEEVPVEEVPEEEVGEEEVEEGEAEEAEVEEGEAEVEQAEGEEVEGEEEVSGDVEAETADAAEAVPGGPDIGLGYVEAPDTGEVAEIILVTTSLGSIRRQFFSSQRLKNFLDCKGVVYIIIDSNRDTSSAKKDLPVQMVKESESSVPLGFFADLKDIELFKEWKANRILKVTEETEFNPEPEIIIPQVLVDGVFVGDETVLQDFEEDGDLDWIFSRAACPACLHEKPPDAPSCPSCGVTYRALIPAQYVAEGQVIQMLQGCPYNGEEAAAEERDAKERWAASPSFEGDVDLGTFEEGEEAEEGDEGEEGEEAEL